MKSNHADTPGMLACILRRPVPLAAVGLLVAASVLLGGCGYRPTETFPEEYATVSVPIFENRSFYKGVEYDLAEALSKEMTTRTPYRIASPGAADTVLQGTITQIEQVTGSRTRAGGLPEQMELQIIVDFQWKDLRTGEDIIDRKGFAAVGSYIPTAPVGQTLQVAQHAAVMQMAREIVDQMRGDW